MVGIIFFCGVREVVIAAEQEGVAWQSGPRVRTKSQTLIKSFPEARRPVP